jgi:hypothetical protein
MIGFDSLGNFPHLSAEVDRFATVDDATVDKEQLRPDLGISLHDARCTHVRCGRRKDCPDRAGGKQHENRLERIAGHG